MKVGGGRHFELLPLEKLPERRGDDLLVIHDQDPAARWRELGLCRRLEHLGFPFQSKELRTFPTNLDAASRSRLSPILER